MLTVASQVLRLLTPAERKRSIGLLALMILGGVLETLGVGSVIPAIALLVQKNLDSYPALSGFLATLGNPSHETLITWALVALLSIYTAKSFLVGAITFVQNRFVFDVQTNLSQRIFAVYLRQPYAFHLERNSARLFNTAKGEADMFGTAMASILILGTEAFVLLGITTLLMIVEPVGAAICFGILGGASWLFYKATGSRIASWGAARQHHESLRVLHLMQGLSAVKDIKVLGRETEFLKKHSQHNRETARVSALQTTMNSVPRLWLEWLSVVSVSVLVLVSVSQGRTGSSIVPALALFAAAALRFMPSGNRIFGAVQSLRYNISVIATLNEEISLPVESASASASDARFAHELTLENIRFAYASSETAALYVPKLTIRCGEVVGFIGPSGAGKSTLVDVVLGLLAPQEGRVLADGHDIRGNIRGWQNQIGYVPQQIFLTDESIRRNIAFGLSTDLIDDIAVDKAVDAAHLRVFINSLPNGLETVVGERGVRLSGGQRQRIGIARALYHSPSILLLDEATSALDAQTERSIMESVKEMRRNKTILIVSHRTSTVAECDTIYELSHGRVVRHGRPSEMLAGTSPVAFSS